MLLDRTLDALQADGGTAAAGAMAPDEIGAAAIFHAAGLLDRVPESVDGARAAFGNIAVSVVPADGGDIRYDDIGRSFAIEGATIAQNDGPSSMSALLAILQYARDRADSLLYVPAAMRRDRVGELAERTGAGERFVMSLLVNYRRIAEGVGA